MVAFLYVPKSELRHVVHMWRPKVVDEHFVFTRNVKDYVRAAVAVHHAEGGLLDDDLFLFRHDDHEHTAVIAHLPSMNDDSGGVERLEKWYAQRFENRTLRFALDRPLGRF